MTKKKRSFFYREAALFLMAIEIAPLRREYHVKQNVLD